MRKLINWFLGLDVLSAWLFPMLIALGLVLTVAEVYHRIKYGESLLF